MIEDLRQLFAFAFMVNAFEAGTAVALLAAVVGWFVVLRREAFAAHTLAVVGFPGAAGAVLIGAPAAAGYFAMTGLAAVALIPSALSGRSKGLNETALIGTVQSFALSLGFLFVTVGHKNLSTAQALLFGSFLGITTEQVATLLALTLVILVIMGCIGRPLLFASIDPEVARSLGVPTRVLEAVFVLLLAVAVAEASQITGSLLVFALLVIPAATAQTMTVRAGAGLGLAVGCALLSTWGGLAVSYFANLPIGFTVTTIGFACFLAARASVSVSGLRSGRQ